MSMARLIFKRDPKERDKILATCHACDRYYKPLDVCKECKCIITFKAKVKGSTCPLGRWNGS